MTRLYDATHLLRLASYVCVLVGLLINIYRLFVLSAKEAFIVQDIATGSFVDVNQRVCDIFGYSRSEMLRLDLAVLSSGQPPYSRSALAPLLQNAASGSAQVFDWPCRTKDGRVVWIELSMGRGTYGGAEYLLSTARDITDRKKAESALTQERDFLTALIGSLPCFFILIDERGCLRRWNETFPALIGLSDDQLLGLDAISIVAEKDRDIARVKMQEAFSRGFADVVVGVPTKSSDVRDIRFSGRIITNEGHPYLLVAGVDVTEQREAERRLRESEQRFHTIFDSVNDGIIVHDANTGAFINVNPRLCEMFGYPREELLQLDLADLSAGASPYGIEDAASLLKRAASGQAVLFEWLCKAKDGHQFWIEVSLRPAQFDGHDVLMSAARDITERKRAGDALRASEARFRTIFASVSDGIFISDPDTGRLVEVNPPGCDMFGYSHDEIVGGAIELRSSGIPPYTQNDAFRWLEKARIDGPQTFEWHSKAKDGHLFWAEVSVRHALIGERTFILAIVRDISERKHATEDLAYRDQILHAVTVGTRELIAEESIGAGMSKALKTVGEAINVERVLVLENVFDLNAPPTLRYSWQAAGLAVRMDQAMLLASTPDAPEALDAWLTPLSEGKPIIAHARTAEAPIRRLLETLQNKSMLLMPILVGGRIWGTIGIDDCKSEREWTESEIDVLGTFAEIIGIVIQRNRAQVSLRSSEERFRAVSETALDAVIMIDAEARVRY